MTELTTDRSVFLKVSAGVAEKLRSTKDALNTLDDGTVKMSQPLVVRKTFLIITQKS